MAHFAMVTHNIYVQLTFHFAYKSIYDLNGHVEQICIKILLAISVLDYCGQL